MGDIDFDICISTAFSHPLNKPPKYIYMKSSLSRLHCLLGVSLFGIFAGPAAEAIVAGDEVLIDFGLTTEQSPGNWNNVHLNAASSTQNWLINTPYNPVANLTEFNSGNGTGVSFSLESSGNDSGIPTYNNAGQPVVSPFVLSSTRDLAYIGAGSTTVTFTLSGLDDSLLYDFSFFSSITTASSGRLTEFTIDGNTQQVDAFNNTTPLTFSSIASTGGVIDIEWTGAGTTNVAILNAMQINAVPEPTTTATLLGAIVGLLALLRFRRQS